jgi:hypothetical protein
MLPPLKHLQAIYLRWNNADEVSLSVLDQEFDRLTVWASLSPSLEICILPSKSRMSYLHSYLITYAIFRQVQSLG